MLISSVASSNVDTLEEETIVKFGPQVEGIQLDYLFALTSGSTSASIDFNALEICRSIDKISVGIRTGIEYITEGHFGGTYSGSPWTDYNLMLRGTIQAPKMRIDVFGGYTNRSSGDWMYHQERHLFKIGGEAKWLFIANTAGLFVAFRVTPKSERRVGKGTFGIVMYVDF